MACSICDAIPGGQTANTGRDERLPSSTHRLQSLDLGKSSDLRQCPECGALYLWTEDVAFTGSGNNDEETLTRLSSDASATVHALLAGERVDEDVVFALDWSVLDLALSAAVHRHRPLALAYARRIVRELARIDARWLQDLALSIVDRDPELAAIVEPEARQLTTRTPHLMQSVRERCREALEAVPAADDPRVRELLAAIHAAPDDDGPRSVLADHLLQRGDERGELIALQLARPRDGEPIERERELVARHAVQWCGPLDRFFDKQHRTIERGLLAGGRASSYWSAAAELEAVTGASEWTTVTTMYAPRSWAAAIVPAAIRMLGDPVMRSLRALHQVPVVVAHALERSATPPPLVELGLTDPTNPLARELGAVGWARVRHLELRQLGSPQALDAIAGSPLWTRLEQITVASSEHNVFERITDYLAIVERAPAVRRIGLGDGSPFFPDLEGWQAVLTRTDAGHELEARFVSGNYGWTGDRLARALDQLDAGTIRAVRIHATPRFTRDAEPYRRLVAACERHHPVRLELPPPP
ncbi:MAG TPA: TIGR02996 domain-containing protein [Kofleriaceae bacterium]|nr:TIGR02996 domain-containing protein [Kofleriaceae bacterium]